MKNKIFKKEGIKKKNIKLYKKKKIFYYDSIARCCFDPLGKVGEKKGVEVLGDVFVGGKIGSRGLEEMYEFFRIREIDLESFFDKSQELKYINIYGDDFNVICYSGERVLDLLFYYEEGKYGGKTIQEHERVLMAI